MNRKAFRLPQAAAWLLASIAALCTASVLAATTANPAEPSAASESVAAPESVVAPDSTTDSTSEDNQERSVVYSLRDYKRDEPAQTTETTPDEYINDYAGVDGIQRSLEGPDVVITAGTQRTVYEYRQGGQLRLVKIVPRIGRPYYLVPADPTRGFGDLDQANRLLPQWTIIEF